MRSLILRIQRDPGLAFFALALAAATAIYAPSLVRGLVNYDDPWLYTDNTLLHHPSWSAVVTVFTDLDSHARMDLSPEYLPVRDLSVMADYALWGEHYAGFHLTNLLLYLGAIAIWWRALTELGIARPLAGLAVLLWAIHPSHAESVAWLAERKGLLGMLWAGTCALGYARFRAGKSAWWLVLALVGGVAAVWSKAIAAFAVAALGPLELALPEKRVTWRRSLTGLGSIALCAGLAYVPVVLLAVKWSIVGGEAGTFPASRLGAVVGVHGFYLRLAAATIPNAVAYPIATVGPSVLDLVVGALGFMAVGFALVRGSAPLRAAAVIWLFGWLPVGYLLLPLQMVFVADRYLLVPSLGFALALAVAIHQLPRLRGAVIAAVVCAFGARAFDAQLTWRSDVELWHRAATSDAGDPTAWFMYVEALDHAGRTAEAARVVDEAFTHVRTPRLVMHAGLVAFSDGRPADGLAFMTEAAVGGEPRAMANLANVLATNGQPHRALLWARLATVVAPNYANGHRIEGKIARQLDRYSVESRRAFEHAYTLEPREAANRYNLGIALADAGETEQGKALLRSCLGDHELGPLAKLALDHL